MENKRNFIKRERSNDKKIPEVKEPYRGIKVVSEYTNVNTHKRKDETFVLMFRDFLFFDVKSYECRYGDLYIRNIVDGVILKRYFRMNANDQLTVFKNRSEFDEFMNKVKEEGYMFGPEAIKKVPDDSNTRSSHQEYIKRVTSQASDRFILENYVPTIDPNTGDIVSIKSTWDGESFTYEDNPSFFDMVARVFENHSINEVRERKGGTY